MHFLCVVGTRPEAIKLAPLILELRRRAKVTTLCSGQHTHLAQEPLAWFGVPVDERVSIDPGTTTLSSIAGELLLKLEKIFVQCRPDVVIAQGDTTTLLVSAVAAFFLGIPFAHVEAGLRTGDIRSPFPEEFNRTTVSRIAEWHFCPTQRAVEALTKEGIAPARIHLTGNTGIDALRLTLARLPDRVPNAHGNRRILLTAHRRENFGKGLENICQAVGDIVSEFGDVEFVIPVHPNPAAKAVFDARLSGMDRVTLVPPLPYGSLVAEMSAATLILTDSGGIQEEAPFLNKPVLVMRGETERPEAVELGVAALVGTDPQAIVGQVRRLLEDPAAYAAMAGGGSPYGDGYAARRIATAFGLPE